MRDFDVGWEVTDPVRMCVLSEQCFCVVTIVFLTQYGGRRDRNAGYEKRKHRTSRPSSLLILTHPTRSTLIHLMTYIHALHSSILPALLKP